MKTILNLTCASVLALGLASEASAATPTTNQGDAALKSQVEMLMKRVNELEAKERAVGNLTEKEAATTGNNLNLVVSGQVNRAVQWHDDGAHSNVVHVDPTDEASSRFRLEATGKVSDTTRVGAIIEADIRSNRGEFTDVHDANDGNSTFQKRAVEVYGHSDRWGKVTLGHGWMAGARVTRDTDMSNTDVIAMGTTVGQIAGGTVFVDKTLSSVTPAPGAGAANKATTLPGGVPLSVANVFDGADNHREDRIQYDTPTYWGTKLATSHSYRGRNDMWDVALKHACELMGAKVATQVAYFRNLANAGAGHAVTTLPAKYSQWSGSIGALFPIGVSVMFAATHRDWKLKNARDGKIYFGKLGYQQKFIEAGMTAMALDYGHFENMILNRGTTDANIQSKFVGKTYGASLVQHFDRVGTEIYVSARVYKLDGATSQSPRYKDITSLMSGMRVKF